MRALTNQCLLLVAVLVFLPNPADGQISRFFQRSATAARQTHIPSAGPATTASTPNVASPRIQQVQLEELIPNPVVPSPLNEAVVSGLDAAPAMDFSGPTNSAPMAETLAPPPAMESYGETQSSDSYGGSYANDYSDSYAAPVAETPLSEVIGDSSIGQAYDIPLSNVIPQTAAETYSTSDWFRNGDWYSRQEMVMLLRADLPLQHLAVDRSALSNNVFDPNITPSLSTKTTDFTFEAGTRLSIGHRLGRDPANRDHALEFSFFGLFDYTGRASLTPTRPTAGGIFSLVGSQESTYSSLGAIFGINTVGFSTVNFVDGLSSNAQVHLLHQADLNSFELNYVVGARPAKDRLVMQPDGRWVRHATPSKVRGLFAGLRYVRQHDLFQYRGVGQISATGTDLDVGGTYLVKTNNDMIGIQLGGDFVRKRSDWLFGFKGKLGGLVNFADRSSSLSQTTASTEPERVVSTALTEEDLRDETLTFLSEGGAYVAYYVRPNTALRVGYDVLYMNGVATATNNLGIRGSDFAKFEMTGDSLYHGMNFGFEMTW